MNLAVSSTTMHVPKPRPRMIADDALIPLINIVFLMLIFFMIAGQITPPEALSIQPPNSQQGRATEPERILLLMDAEGRIALDDEILTLAAVHERLAARLAAVSAAAGGRVSPGLGITLKADAAVTQGQLRLLLDQLRALGIERLQLLTQQTAG
ncbi:MAG: biopolymer transporter ExbD [Halochromatium sp.]|nr:biopolymer transporter ExbD [Halochromatium sp.]